jgi:hypothetical protein
MAVKLILVEHWPVDREARLEEVSSPGKSPRYRVVLADVGRAPFLQKWFNDLTPASDFIDRVKTGYDPREASS